MKHFSRAHSSQEEVGGLKAELAAARGAAKALDAAPKGLQREVDGLKRDLEKARAKSKEMHGKLQTSIAEKTAALSEKTSLEREVSWNGGFGIREGEGTQKEGECPAEHKWATMARTEPP